MGKQPKYLIKKESEEDLSPSTVIRKRSEKKKLNSRRRLTVYRSPSKEHKIITKFDESTGETQIVNK
jgi:hypothetical protein